MKYALIIFTFVISVCSAQFGNNQSMSKTGTTVAQFLKIGMDARSTGMGGAVAGQKAILTQTCMIIRISTGSRTAA